jgi:hypothetical protein
MEGTVELQSTSAAAGGKAVGHSTAAAAAVIMIDAWRASFEAGSIDVSTPATRLGVGARARRLPEPARRIDPRGSKAPHVLLLHLDGYRPDLTRRLLAAGRLPHLGHLVSRGRVSFAAATVDKSETMKVIPSYLTSRLDSSALGVAGWWQFDRSDFRFHNYWLDPAEVLNYALGLSFPRAPTVQDFLAARGENLVSSMSLARRGVPFENYGRAYLEGIEAVSHHTYLRQADATLEAFLEIHNRIAERVGAAGASEPTGNGTTALSPRTT